MSTHPTQLTITVNGEAQAVPAGSTLPELLRQRDLNPDFSKGIAVAVNEEVVPKKNWQDVVLKAEDRVEIVTAKQGG